MKLIRCTRKVLGELDLPVSDVTVESSLDPCLGEWYGNLRRFFRRRAFLFTHADTLFSFWISDLKKADTEDLGLIFATHLAANLAHEGFSQSIIRKATADTTVQIGRTLNRSVLGSMNDFAYLSEFRIARAGGLPTTNLLELNKDLNRTPMGAIGMDFPIEALTQKLMGGGKVVPIGFRRPTDAALN